MIPEAVAVEVAGDRLVAAHPKTLGAPAQRDADIFGIPFDFTAEPSVAPATAFDDMIPR